MVIQMNVSIVVGDLQLGNKKDMPGPCLESPGFSYMNIEHLHMVRLHDLVRICHLTCFFIWHNNSSRSLPPKSWGGRWEDNNGITHCCRRLKSILERTLHMMIFLTYSNLPGDFHHARLPCALQKRFSFFPCGR